MPPILSNIEAQNYYNIFRFGNDGIGGFPNDKNKNAPYLFDKERNEYPDDAGLKYYFPEGYNKVIKKDGKVIYHSNRFRYHKHLWYKTNLGENITYGVIFQGLTLINCKVIGEGIDKPKTYATGDYYPEGRSYIKLKLY
jgi:hypothetical protein